MSDLICEGCSDLATTTDMDGVPLCDECMKALIADSKRERDEKAKESGR